MAMTGRFLTKVAGIKARTVKANDVAAGFGLVIGTGDVVSVFGTDAQGDQLDLSSVATITVACDNAALFTIVSPPATPNPAPPSPAMQYQEKAASTPPVAGAGTVTITPKWNDATKPALPTLSYLLTATLDPNSATGLTLTRSQVTVN